MSLKTYRYQLDPTGVSPDNFVQGEPHSLNNGSRFRPLAPINGAFFTDSIAVRDRTTGLPLVKGVQFYSFELYETPSAKYGKEICALVMVTDPNVSNEVEIDYQCLGDEYSTQQLAVLNQLEALMLDNRPVAYGNLAKKPSDFAPQLHRHDVGDISGFESTTHAINRLRQAVELGDAASHDEVYQYIDRLSGELHGIIDTMQASLTDHEDDQDNPHRVTAAQLGAYTKAQVDVVLVPLRDAINAHVANTNNPHVVTPSQLGVYIKSEINTLFSNLQTTLTTLLNNHINNKLNPHNVSAAQLGAYTKSQSDAITTPLANSISAHIARKDNPHGVTAAQLSAYTAAEVNALVGSNQSALTAHITNTNNPHGLTAAQLGVYTTSEVDAKLLTKANPSVENNWSKEQTFDTGVVLKIAGSANGYVKLAAEVDTQGRYMFKTSFLDKLTGQSFTVHKLNIVTGDEYLGGTLYANGDIAAMAATNEVVSKTLMDVTTAVTVNIDTIDDAYTPAKLKTAVLAALGGSWANAANIRIVISATSRLVGANVGEAPLYFDTDYGNRTVMVENSGVVLGRGGRGADAETGAGLQSGGDGIVASTGINLMVDNRGVIGGGGGGGAAGASSDCLLRTGDQITFTSNASAWTRWTYDSSTDAAAVTEGAATVSKTPNAGWAAHGPKPFRVRLGAVVEFSVDGGDLGSFTFRLTHTGVTKGQSVFDVRRGEIRADGSLWLYGGGYAWSSGYIKIISDGNVGTGGGGGAPYGTGGNGYAAGATATQYVGGVAGAGNSLAKPGTSGGDAGQAGIASTAGVGGTASGTAGAAIRLMGAARCTYMNRGDLRGAAPI